MHYHTPLLTDLYQLTMAAGYWHAGRAEQEAAQRVLEVLAPEVIEQ